MKFNVPQFTFLVCSICLISSVSNRAEAQDLVQAQEPYFDVQCQFASAAAEGAAEGAQSECVARMQLCAQGSGPECRDQGLASCSLPDFQTRYEGQFARSTHGNEVILTAMSQVPGEPAPVVVMGPAKTPPRPGQPVVADSRLDYGDFHFQGECAVRLVR